MTNAYILTPFFLERQRLRLLRLAQKGWHVNQPSVSGRGQLKRMAAIHAPLAAFVAESARHGERPVSIAGDCCAAIAVLAGLQRAGTSPVLVWLDAHGDFNTPDTSPSGFIGGMPLAMIVGRGDQALVQAAGLTPLAEQDVVLCDARDLDPLERTALEQSGVHRVADVTRLLDHVPQGRPVHVHFDTDILDPSEAPAQLYSVPGGPGVATLSAAFAALATHRDVAAVSVSAWDLATDRRRATEQVVLAALGALIGPH